jgi:aspartyl-tRNA(Asn)/glutamyl-tRNA(Gln) amidotransferase subunit A
MSASPEALRRQDATAQRAALAGGAVRPSALLEAHLAAIQRLDPQLGCFWHLDVEGARRQAQECERRIAGGAARALEGLPLAVKDNIDVAGMPTTAGMATRRGQIAEKDAEVVRRLRAAGAILLGKLAMHEGALGADNDNPHYGRCHNPHRRGHTPGGSSGGSAAAVAAGLVPLALGTDSMGSVRIPGAYCGVFALKPSLGRVPSEGVVPVSARLDTVGWLARSARDLNLLLPLLADESPPPPPRWRPSLLALWPSGGCESAVLEGFRRALLACRQLGHPLKEAALPDPQRLSCWRRAGLLLCEAEMLIVHERDWRERPELFSPRLAALLRFAEGKGAADLARALLRIDEARAYVFRLLAQAEVLILPATPQRAFPFGAAIPADQADYTCLASLAGCPAVAVPLFPEDGGLPCAVQLLGKPGREAALIALAEALAQALGLAIEPVEPSP